MESQIELNISCKETIENLHSKIWSLKNVFDFEVITVYAHSLEIPKQVRDDALIEQAGSMMRHAEEKIPRCGKTTEDEPDYHLRLRWFLSNLFPNLLLN